MALAVSTIEAQAALRRFGQAVQREELNRHARERISRWWPARRVAEHFRRLKYVAARILEKCIVHHVPLLYCSVR